MKLLAFDTETYLIAPRESVPQGAVQINVSPYVTPKLVLGSIARAGDVEPTVMTPAELRDTLLAALADPETHLIAHYFAFDRDVVCAMFPELVEPFRAALSAGRCHDTKILDVLARLASGYFDTPDPNANWALPEVKPRSLDVLAFEYLNVQVPKDLVDDDGDLVRLSFHKWDGVPLKDVPAVYLIYAGGDALVTRSLFQHLAARAPADLWGEPAQVRAEVAFYELDKIGVRIDQLEAQRLLLLFNKDLPSLQEKMVEHGLGVWLPLQGTRNVTKENRAESTANSGTLSIKNRLGQRGSRQHMLGVGGDDNEQRIRDVRILQNTSPRDGMSDSAGAPDLVCSVQGSSPESHGGDAPLRQQNLCEPDTSALRDPHGECSRCLDEGPEKETPRRGHWTYVEGRLHRITEFKTHIRKETATPSFHLCTGELRQRVAALVEERGLEVKKTPTGLSACNADDLKNVIPSEYTDLQAWLAYAKLVKILSAYLSLYSRVTQVFPRWYTLRARTGRTATASPAVQQIPKNKHGIRSLFVPHDGFVFVKADYSFQELVTLAQEMLELGIKGPLYDAIQIGDPHTSTAALLLNCDPATIGKKSPERQAAKALNFGCPGGLGAAKLRDYAAKDPYRINWTVEQAKEMRQRFLAVYPDIEEYLEKHKTSLSANLLRVTGRNAQYWCEKLGVRSFGDLRKAMVTSKDPAIRGLFYKAERSLEVRLGTGFVRKGCAFTEGANTRFQGRAASVSKEAMWRVFSCPELRALNARAVMMIHDEIVLETPLANAARASELLVQHMLSAFTAVCPDTGPFAKVEVEGPLIRWGKATDSAGLSV